MGKSIRNRRQFIGTNGEQVRNLRGNLWGFSGNLYGIGKEFVGRITEEFVWKYCVLVWYYWGTNGDFVGNYWETRLAAVRNSRGHCRELVGIREDFLRNPCGSTGEFLRHYL